MLAVLKILRLASMSYSVKLPASVNFHLVRCQIRLPVPDDLLRTADQLFIDPLISQDLFTAHLLDFSRTEFMFTD